MALAVDRNFLLRLQYSIVMTARTVLSETGVGATHSARVAYARNVIMSPAQATANAATVIVGGTNLIGTVTVTDGIAVTSASDGAIFSQVNTFWNALSGIDTGN